MKKIIALIFLFVFLLGSSSWAADNPKEGLYSAIRFNAPSSQEDLAYLGLATGDSTFSLSDVKADVLIVEVYSMDCPHCQRQVKNMKELFLLLKDKGYADKIKLVGIGIGNSDFSTQLFRKKYAVNFPLVADPDSLSYKITGRVAIPFLIVLKRNEAGDLAKVYAKDREKDEAQTMLNVVLENTGLKQEKQL